jgi:hypothetical protein
MCRTRRFTF